VFDPSGLPVVAIAWSYRSAFAPMLRARVEPTAAEPLAAQRAPAPV